MRVFPHLLKFTIYSVGSGGQLPLVFRDPSQTLIWDTGCKHGVSLSHAINVGKNRTV